VAESFLLWTVKSEFMKNI